MRAVLDRDLQLELLSHVAENLGARASTSTGGNLILAIEGRPGEGKSFHCKTVLGAAGVAIHRFSLADFECQAAGVPATRLVEKYLSVSDSILDGQPSVLIIEDIDLGLGPERAPGASNDVVQYTMNRDLLVGTLMALCDSPRYVQVPSDAAHPSAGKSQICERVPIVMTGNALANVYGALLRHGRTRLVRWAPSTETRIRVLIQLFPLLTAAEAGALVEHFDGEPISFWNALAMELESEQVRTMIGGYLDHNPETSVIDIVNWLSGPSEFEVSVTEVASLGERMRRQRNQEEP